MKISSNPHTNPSVATAANLPVLLIKHWSLLWSRNLRGREAKGKGSGLGGGAFRNPSKSAPSLWFSEQMAWCQRHYGANILLSSPQSVQGQTVGSWRTTEIIFLGLVKRNVTTDKKWGFKMFLSILFCFLLPLLHPAKKRPSAGQPPSSLCPGCHQWKGLLVLQCLCWRFLLWSPLLERRQRRGRCFHGNLYLNRLGSQTWNGSSLLPPTSCLWSIWNSTCDHHMRPLQDCSKLKHNREF